MRAWMSRIMAAAMLLVVLSPAVSAVGETPRTPRAVVETFHRYLVEGDTAGVLSLLTRNVIFFELGQSENSRREYEQVHLAGDIRRAARSKLRRLSRRVTGDKAVRWVLSVYRIEDDTNLNVRLAETIILRNKSGKWRIAHIHWSETPVSP